MAENINEALGLSQTMTSGEPQGERRKDDNSAENTLSTIATIVLIFGLIATLVCLFTLTSIEVGYHKEFNPIGLGYTVMVLMSTLISWSVMKVLSNISLTLKDLNGKIKSEEKPQVPKAQASTPAKTKSKNKEQRITELKPLVETGALSQQELDELIDEEFKEQSMKN